jgi:N utilization substance protein B
LAAVQALYEIDMTGAAPEGVVLDILDKRWGEREVSSEEGAPNLADMADPDRELLAMLVRGVGKRRTELDSMADAALAEGWSMGRLEVVLRCIVRAGTFELLGRPETPAKVIINEYVDLAHAFFSGGEPAMVNGVLDRLARTLRPDETAPGGGERARDAG